MGKGAIAYADNRFYCLGEGDGRIKDGIDGEGTDEGTPLVNQKKGHPTSVKGKSNVVKSKIKGGGKGDQSFFQKNN